MHFVNKSEYLTAPWNEMHPFSPCLEGQGHSYTYDGFIKHASHVVKALRLGCWRTLPTLRATVVLLCIFRLIY